MAPPNTALRNTLNIHTCTHTYTHMHVHTHIHTQFHLKAALAAARAAVRGRGVMEMQRERCQWAIRPRAAVLLVVVLAVVVVVVVVVEGKGKYRFFQALVKGGARGAKGRVSRRPLASVVSWTALSVGRHLGKVGKEDLLLLLVLVVVVVMVLVVMVEGKGVGSNSSSRSNNYHKWRRLR